MGAELAAMGGLAVASGALQAYQSDKGRKATAEERDRINELFSKLKTPQFDVSGQPLPNFDQTQLTPQEYQFLKQYAPKTAQYIEERAPTLIKDTADMTSGREAQLAALNQMRNVASGAPDLQFEGSLNEASRRMKQAANTNQQNVLMGAERRGQLNSGAALAAELQGGAAAQQNAGLAGEQAAMDAYKNRLNAMRGAADLGGNIRSADEGMQYRNASIINDYNQRLARGQQANMNQNTDIMNNAQRYNLEGNQRAADKNTDQANAYSVMNRNRNDTLAQQKYQNALNDQRYGNTLKQQQFGNEAQIASGQAGLGYQNIADIRQNTADRNQMISGLGQAGTAGAMYYGNSNERAADRQNNKDIAQYKNTGAWPGEEDENGAVG